MNGVICFICNKTYYSDNETRIHVERIEREGTTVKTIEWDGMLCDKCLGRLLGKEGGEECVGRECGFYGSVCCADAQRDANGTCPNDNGTCPDDAHSKTEPNLTEQSELLSDDSDSREKLEADVRDYYRIGLPGIQETELNRLYCKQVLEWLDRQAAITERKHLELACAFQLESDKRITELGSGTCELKWTLQGKTQTQEFWRCECGNCGECFGVESRESFPFKMTVGKVDTPNYCPNCGIKVISYDK